MGDTVAFDRDFMPTAQVSHGHPYLGTHQAFALLGWVEQRRNGWPRVGLRMTLLGEDLETVTGGITMGLPLTPDTERRVCCFLEDLGWDGRVWPYEDHGWPEKTEDESGLLGLLKAANLGATLTFPPQAQGTPVVSIPIKDRKRPFRVMPFGPPNETPRYLETLRNLASNPKPFVSDWTQHE